MGGSRGRLFALRLPGAPTTVSLSLYLGGSGPDLEAAPRGAVSRLQGRAVLRTSGSPGHPAGALAGRLPGWGGLSALRRRRETPASAAGPRGRSLKVSPGILRAAVATWFLLLLASASPTLFPETSQRRRSGKGGG